MRWVIWPGIHRTLNSNALYLSLLLLVLSTTSRATINLNTSSDYWRYTIAKAFPDGVSAECQLAYAKDIQCEDTLFILASKFTNDFHATVPQLRKTCTSECKTSLSRYTRDLGSACNQQSDVVIPNGGDGQHRPPVYRIGQILQVAYAQACLVDENNKYCFAGEEAHVSVDCNDACSIQFYENSHNMAPASYKRIDNTGLQTRTKYWIKQFENGYKAIQSCTNSSSASASSTVGSMTAVPGVQEVVTTTPSVLSIQQAGTTGTTTSPTTVSSSQGSGGASMAMGFDPTRSVSGFLLISLGVFAGAFQFLA